MEVPKLPETRAEVRMKGLEAKIRELEAEIVRLTKLAALFPNG